MADAWDKLSGIKSEKQYKYILALLFNKKYIKLNKIMFEFGFKQILSKRYVS